MKERLQHLLSEAGENIDYIRSDIRNFSRYLAELEELVEKYRAFTIHAQLQAPNDKATRRILLRKTQKVVGPLPDVSGEEGSSSAP